MLKLKSQEKYIWWFCFIFALAGVVLMILDCYTRSDSQFRRDPAWYEKVILPFYFTFISNVMGVLLPLVKVSPLKKYRKFVRNFEILTSVNLLATMIVYWSTLYTEHNVKTNIAWASNGFVHTATPILIIAVTMLFVWLNKVKIEYKNVYVSTLTLLWFLFTWIVVALIVYFALGMNKDGAIYFFLDVAHNSWWKSLLFGIFSPVVYYLLVLGFTILLNRLSKK